MHHCLMERKTKRSHTESFDPSIISSPTWLDASGEIGWLGEEAAKNIVIKSFI